MKNVIKISVLLLLTSSLYGTTVYVRTPNTNYCDVTGATNATPVVISVSNYSRCGVIAGDIIAVEGIGGNTAANWNPGTSSGTTKHLARKVKAGSLSVNSGADTATFSITDLTDVDVAGNGAYTSGGYIGKVTAKTLNASPILYLDGPSGSATTGLAAKYVGTNPHQVGLISASNVILSKTAGWGRANSGYNPEAFVHTAAGAMRYFMDNTATTTGDAISFDLDSPEVVYGGGATKAECRDGANPATSIADYGGQTMTTLAYAATLADAAGKLTSAQKTNITRFAWDGVPWDTKGGSDYSGVSWSSNTWKINMSSCGAFGEYYPDYTHGTISYTGGTTSITGSGTSFLTDISTGDIVMIGHTVENGSALSVKVSTCSSNTSCTISTELNLNASNVHFAVQKGWSQGKTGWFWSQCHYGAAPLCGASSASPASLIAAPGNPGGYGSNEYTNNLVLARLIGIHSIGLVTCSWAGTTGDYRGCWMAARASMILNDHSLRGYMQKAASGNSTSTHSYNWWRVLAPINEWAVFEKRSFTSGVDRLPQKMIDGAMEHGPMNWIKYWAWPAWGEHTRYDDTDAAVTIDLLASVLGPDATLKQKWYDWYKNKRGVLGTYHYTAKNFSLYDPAQSTATVGTSWVANQTATAECQSIFGARCSEPDSGAFGVFSKTSWASNRHAQMVALTPQCVDHCGNGVPQLSIIQGLTGAGDPGRLLIGGGTSTDELSDPLHRSAPIVVTSTNTYEYPVAAYPGNTSVKGRGDDNFIASETTYTPWYRTSANVSDAKRTWIHFKASGRDYHVLRDYVATSSPKSMYGQFLLRLTGCGTSTSSTCVSANRSAKTFQNQQASVGAGLLGKVGAFTSNVLLNTENNSDSNLSYTGQTGASGKVTVCMSANGTTCDASNSALEYAVIMKQTDGTGSLPTISTSQSGSLRIAEIQDSSVPAVAVMGPAGAAISTGSFTTTHSGTAQYVITNLSTGTINVSRDGSSVSGSPFTVSTDGVVAFNASSGTFSISQNASYYASTTGSSGNPGTLASPWSFSHAISSANTTIQPGDTVYVRGGTYTGRYVVTKAGTAGNLITYRPYQASGQAPETVIIDRQILTDGQNAALEIPSTGGYVRLIGFRVTNSNTDRRSAFDTSNPTDMRPAGVESFAPGVQIVNFTIDNNGTGLAAWSTGATEDSSLFYGNVIIGNGWQSATPTERGHGHGCYMQNQATGTKTLRHNISLWNFNHGCQIYGSGDTGVYIKGFTVDQNTFFENGEPSLQGYDRQLLVGAGQFCSSNTVTSNNTWLPVGSSAQSLNLGYQATLFCNSFTASNNYLIGGEMRIVGQRANFSTSTLTGNSVYATVGWEDTAGNGGYETGWSVTIPTMSATSQSGNTQISSTPVSNRVVIQPNEFESNRGTIVVYNWTGASSASVDVSSFLSPGTSYKVMDVQNWFGSPVLTGTYTSGSISIPLTGTTTSSLVGDNPGTDFNQPSHTTSQFNTFVVMQNFESSGESSAGSVSLRGTISTRGTSTIR